MPEAPHPRITSTIAKGATAQLRDIAEYADRDTAQPIFRELMRIAYQMARKHGFQLGQTPITSKGGTSV